MKGTYKNYEYEIDEYAYGYSIKLPNGTNELYQPYAGNRVFDIGDDERKKLTRSRVYNRINVLIKQYGNQPSKKINNDIINWGFDLTSFESSKDFQYIIDKYKLKYSKSQPYKEDNRYSQFKWSNKDVEIVTGNNPITGEYTNPKQRKSEKGYASYIGITGKKDIVMGIVSYIKKNASIKDESPNSRDYI